MKLLFLHIGCFAFLNLVMLVLGYQCVKRKMILAGWVLLVLSVVLIDRIFLAQHPILRMLAIIATTFTGMKVIAVTESYKHQKLTLSFKQWFAFSGWAGMRAQPFEALPGKPLPNAWPLIVTGISRVVAGGVLVLLARQLFNFAINPALSYIIISGLLLVGFSLILHFGFLAISAGMWRLSGVNTYLLFRKPATATSLTEFWSKRWNIAFTEMTSIAIFRPLKNKIGNASALMLAFIFSGLLHELALSFPVNSGYGLPTLYFIIQGGLVIIEKYLATNKILFLQNKIIARVWVFCWLVIPMPLLFHHQFIKYILWPLAGLH